MILCSCVPAWQSEFTLDRQIQLLSNPDLAAKMIGPYGPNHTAALLAEGASCTIYVGNLNPSITAEQLNQFFSAVCGQVRRCS